MNDESIDDDVRAQIVGYCAQFLSGPWATLKRNDAIITKFSAGFANKNYCCALPESATNEAIEDCPKEVVVHLYGSDVLDGMLIQKYNGESAEAVVCKILSDLKLGPKIYGVFDGGRIEEYIPSRHATADDYKAVETNCCIARKLAKWHTLKMPICKLPNRVAVTRKQFGAVGECSIWNGASAEAVEAIKGINAFPFDNEMEWFEKICRRLDDRVVFCHMDLYLGNILVREETQSLDDRFLIIDYEMCGYFYQCYDLANFLEYRKWFVKRAEDLEIHYVEDQNEAQIRKCFIEEYLSSWKTSPLYDSKRDTVERFEMNIAFMELIVDLISIGTLKLGVANIPSEQLAKHTNVICSNYSVKKDKVLAKYGKVIDVQDNL